METTSDYGERYAALSRWLQERIGFDRAQGVVSVTALLRAEEARSVAERASHMQRQLRELGMQRGDSPAAFRRLYANDRAIAAFLHRLARLKP